MQDLKLAIRLMTRNWGLSLAVIAILGLCIGANTAVLSVVNAAIMRPLPYVSPGRLFNVVTIFPRDTDAFQTSVDGLTWELVRDRVPVLDVAVYGGSFGGGVNMGVNGNGVLVEQGRVSAGFFRVLGSAPMIGREFSPDEDRPGGPGAVVLSHALWLKYFGGDPNVVGRSILLRGEPHAVIGVMPEDFRWLSDTELWTTLRPSRTGEGGGSNYGMIARLRPGASPEQAEEQLALLTEEVRREGSYGRNSGVRISIVPLQKGVTQDLRQPLKILWTAVTAVFLLGCVNVAGMLLASSSGRAGEMATRLALGASQSRIVRQLLLESAVICLIGGAVGLLMGRSALGTLRALGKNTFPFLKTVDHSA